MKANEFLESKSNPQFNNVRPMLSLLDGAHYRLLVDLMEEYKLQSNDELLIKFYDYLADNGEYLYDDERKMNIDNFKEYDAKR